MRPWLHVCLSVDRHGRIRLEFVRALELLFLEPALPECTLGSRLVGDACGPIARVTSDEEEVE